jgi:hypothetical protein
MRIHLSKFQFPDDENGYDCRNLCLFAVYLFRTAGSTKYSNIKYIQDPKAMNNASVLLVSLRGPYRLFQRPSAS